MRKLVTLIGRVAFWILWPALYVYMRGSRRTRVLVMHDDEVLVIKHWLGRDFWQLPGGGLHKKEAVLVGAARELLEETGIVAAYADLQYLGAEHAKVAGIPLVQEYVCLTVTVKPQVTMQKIEIRTYAWLHKTDHAVVASRSLMRALDRLQHST